MAIVHVNTENFEQVVLRSELPVLVDFWAAWCGPCRMLAPILEELADEPDFTIAKIDVDENPELAMQFGIVSIPTLFVFRNGKVVHRAVGVVSKAEIRTMMA